MKEKDRLRNLCEYLRAENIKWTVEIHGGRIWHAIMQFPTPRYKAQFARGYSVLAELDKSLPLGMQRIRGLLISLGRALKAGTACKNGGQVTTDFVLELLRGYCCPGSYGSLPVYKSQCRVVPTIRELELLQRVEEPGMQRISVEVAPDAPETSDERISEFLRRMLEQYYNKTVRKSDLASAYMGYSALDLADKVADLKKLLSDDWLEKHGFSVITQKLVRAAV